MHYLLDTHVWLWMCTEPEKISKKALNIIENNSSELLLSSASVWEIVIKIQIGKLHLSSEVSEYISSRIIKTKVQILSINLNHCFELTKLPDHHRDPFDRMVVAQAQADKLILLSADEKLKPYSIEIIW